MKALTRDDTEHGVLYYKASEVDAVLAQGAQPAQTGWLPIESSQEAADSIATVMKEYNYPANPANCARVGWRAARLYAAPDTSQKEQSND